MSIQWNEVYQGLDTQCFVVQYVVLEYLLVDGKVLHHLWLLLY